ncbi:MAG TPA: bifunctional phosphoribosylaminoimidazolecarboxamide formyltransferase/IMP cyclohydrolase [Gammaproteobacteria bacterium]|nr:bifunctional phosphoribosylaminoimidazolecarboxamide formyltransferase/IMP cyclohydrolase [Gammaproteobacteria bacterium]
MRRRRALLSVSDKNGVVEFARGLAELDYTIVSTGGTAASLREAGLAVTDVAEITEFPEIMDGRVKTLHPRVHGGLLARSGVDESIAAEHGIEYFDLLAVNLYPFLKVTARADCSFDTAIENIDIGGPAMLRAAAKNHERLTVVVDSQDYARVLAALRSEQDSGALRRELAYKAFAHTAAYDAAITAWLERQTGAQAHPETLVLTASRRQNLRYGENPHQRAALYTFGESAGGTVATAAQLQGKELSFNNIADADAAKQCVQAFDQCACVIVKHANPCGVAVAQDPESAYRLAYECDATSAFGGIIAFNTTLDGAAASAIVAQQFAEVVVAPGYAADALAAFADKPNIRVLSLARGQSVPMREIRSIEGGWLVQDHDRGSWADVQPRSVCAREPTDAQLADLRFAWTVAKFVKSNAIVYASGQRTLGIGAGQMSRVDSARIAALKAAEAGFDLAGAAMASDAFFPFRDAIDAAADRGITAIVHPGGGMREAEVIAAADEHGMAMILTGMRHFRH